VSLVPPPWLELTTSDPSLSATARQARPGTMVVCSLPVSNERAQIDVAGRQALFGAGRAGRQRQRRLRR